MGVNRADVFAQDADEEELHGAQEKDAYHDGRGTYLESVPEEQLVDQLSERYQKTDGADAAAGKNGQAQRDLRVVDDAQHP